MSKSTTKKSMARRRIERTWRVTLNMEKKMKSSKITATKSLSMKSIQRMRGQVMKNQV